VNAVNGTVRPPHTGRRTVRRARPAIDQAYEKALPDLAPELRVGLVAFVDARKSEREARNALSTVMTRHGQRELEIEKLAAVIS
jgi:RNase H-fold protein (predicted Holliday junction resolvase)